MKEIKYCIWCNRSELQTDFKTKAHIFPDSVGGKHICINVCDNCNRKFGNKQQFQPSVDIAVKEIFNLSKYLLLERKNDKKSVKKRFKSEYFNLNLDKKKISIKPSYKFKPRFQENFARSFRRGIYKIFLEERERLFSDARSDEFNFIRSFSRFNLGDIPLYYLKPKAPIIFLDETQFYNPELKFTAYHEKLHKDYRLYEFYYGGYSYLLHTNDFMKEFHLKNYFNDVIKNESNYLKISTLIQIEKMEDLDFRYQLFKEL